MTLSPSHLRVFAVAVVAFCLVVGACGSDDSSDQGDSSDQVTGEVWELQEIGGEPVPDGVVPTLEFDGETISGNGGCNQFSGGAAFDAGVVEVSPALAVTQMACLDDAGDIELIYLQVLPTATGFAVDGDTLTLTNDNDDAILIYTSAS